MFQNNGLRRKVKWAALVVAVCAGTGFGLHEVLEYAQVARVALAKTIEKHVPLSVELERLKVIVGKLDNQITEHRRTIAEKLVELERSEQDVAGVQVEVQRGRQSMASLRSVLNQSGCSIRMGCHTYSKAEIERALQRQLESYKAAKEGLTQREQALEQQRDSFRTLAGRLAEWRQQRDLLWQKVQTLETQYAAQQSSQSSPATVFDGDLMARAKELASRIEDRLKVEQKLQSLGLEQTTVIPMNDPPSDVAAQVDRLVESETGAKTAGATE